MQRDEGALREERGVAGLYRGEGALRGERGIAGLYRGEGALRGELPRDEHPDCSLHFALEFKKEREIRLGDEDVLVDTICSSDFQIWVWGEKSRNETFAAVDVWYKTN